MSIFTKLISFAFLAPALLAPPKEKGANKTKRKGARKSPASRGRAASRSERDSKKAGPKSTGKSVGSPGKSVGVQRTATRRVLFKAGRTAVAWARQGTQRVAHTSRSTLARAARSAAQGLQSAARGIGDSGASALETLADRVTPMEQK
jgi:hypothetical protein